MLAVYDVAHSLPLEGFLLYECNIGRIADEEQGIKGPSINYVTRISWFFYSSPVLVTGGHISETPLPSVTSHILQFYT